MNLSGSGCKQWLQVNLPYSPISRLILLLSFEIGELIEKKRQTSCRVAQSSSCVVRVEESHNIETKISLEPYDIHVCAV